MPLSQYQMATPGVSGFGQAMNQIAVGMAQQKYMMEQQRQETAMKQAQLASQMAHQRAQEALYGQQMKSEVAQAEHYGAQTASLKQEAGARDELGQAGWNLGMIQAGENQGIDMGPRRDIAISRALGAMGQLKDADRSKYVENVAQGLQLPNQRMQQFMALGQKPIIEVSPGASVYNLLSGQNEFSSLRTLSEGQVLRPNIAGQQGLSPTFSPSAGNMLSQNTAVDAMMNPMFGRLPPQVQSAIKGMQINVPSGTNQPAMQPTGLPDKETARKEGLQFLQSHPNKADAIRKRFFDAYKEPIDGALDQTLKQ